MTGELPLIESARLVLKPVEASEAAAVQALSAVANVRRYLMDGTAFTHAGLREVRASMDEPNEASIRVLGRRVEPGVRPGG